jgi:hypothetical protein
MSTKHFPLCAPQPGCVYAYVGLAHGINLQT